MKRILSVFLITAILFSCLAISANAMQSRASLVLQSCSALLSRTTAGDLAVTVSVRAVSRQEEIGILQLVVERSQGNSWIEEYTVELDDNSAFSISNSTSFLRTFHINGTSGEEYRVKVEGFARTGDLFDSTWAESTAVTYP